MQSISTLDPGCRPSTSEPFESRHGMAGDCALICGVVVGGCVVVGGGVVVAGEHLAYGPSLEPKFQSQSSNKLSMEQVQVMPFSVTVCPSSMMVPDGVLQLSPGGDGVKC